MPGRSKKAFKKNVEVEMKAGKPQAQSLAVAYGMKNKGKKKKMAEGGAISASNEKRPMPDNRYNDSKEASHNSSNKAPMNDRVTDTPERAQAAKGKTYALKHPKMVPQSVYSTRLRDQEDDLEMTASPGPYGKQPPKEDDEDGADRKGPKVPDMQDEHSTSRKPYAKGGKIQDSDEHIRLYGKYEDDLTDLGPSMDEGSSNAKSRNEAGAERKGPSMAKPEAHSEHDEMYDDAMEATEDSHAYAEGGSVEDEREIEHAASIAAAIMQQRKAAKQESGSHDEDQAEMYAEGGEIMEKSAPNKSRDSIYSDDSDQADLSRNADEDENMEDQLSFDALKKENYSESEGLDALDQPHDSNLKGDDREDRDENRNDSRIVSAIRRKMKMKSPISR